MLLIQTLDSHIISYHRLYYLPQKYRILMSFY